MDELLAVNIATDVKKILAEQKAAKHQGRKILGAMVVGAVAWTYLSKKAREYMAEHKDA